MLNIFILIVLLLFKIRLSLNLHFFFVTNILIHILISQIKIYGSLLKPYIINALFLIIDSFSECLSLL